MQHKLKSDRVDSVLLNSFWEAVAYERFPGDFLELSKRFAFISIFAKCTRLCTHKLQKNSSSEQIPLLFRKNLPWNSNEVFAHVAWIIDGEIF